MRILVVGDSYLSVEVFRRGLANVATRAELRFLQLDRNRTLEPATDSERSIREYEGHPDEIRGAIDGAHALVVHGAAVTEEVLEAAPGLRLVACARGGPVNIDVGAATARGIPVVTTPGKNAEAVADLVLAFMVMLTRKLPYAQHVAAAGKLGESNFEGAQFFGRELAGRRLGLVGYGNVARAVTRRVLPLGVRVSAYDPHVEVDASQLVERATTLPELLAGSDIISLHARASVENECMIGAGEFAAMPRGAYFINTARETLLDEGALDAALASGHISGAALDVVRVSGAGAHPLHAHGNVIITPHIGGATHETLDRGVAMIAAELLALADDRPLVHLANPEALAV